MVTRSMAATLAPDYQGVTEPTIDPSAQVHSFAQVVGDVRIGQAVVIGPGAIIRADEGTPFAIGAATSIQDGVVIHGLQQGRVLGDDQHPYSVWLGARVCLTHKAIVHGPAYLGDDCFVGFRSTIFNARLGPGCVVMMHALVQDVEVPAGRYVPSGAIITHQEQADQLPDADAEDLAFVQEIVTLNQDIRSRDRAGEATATSAHAPDQSRSERAPLTSIAHDNGNKTMQPQRLTPDIVQQVRQLLNQGYRIGTEHADVRRYRSNVWKTCAPIQSSRESEVLAALEACLEEHTGEYVRMFGIDPTAKRRVATTTIQRPDGRPVAVNSQSVPAAGASHGSRNGASTTAAQGASPGLVQQVRNLLNQGYRIGTEHADERRFRCNVWQTCAPIEARRENEVLTALQACLQEHQGEYVRLFGIDPVAKRRIAPAIIQRPHESAVLNGEGATSRVTSSAAAGGYTNRTSQGATASGGLTPEAVQQVRTLLSQGYRIGTEHADERRFRSNVWQTCRPIEATRESDVLAALTACVQDHAGEYVRLFGIDPKAKRRLAPVVIHRPGDTRQNGHTTGVSSPPRATSADRSQPAPAASASNGAGANGHALKSEVAQQVRQLVGQGYQVSLEHADVRRYHSGAWQSGGILEGRNPADVLSALEASLAAHSGEYVRLIGIDPQAKRRVLETTIQRPNP